jgi:hypothetical protein
MTALKLLKPGIAGRSAMLRTASRLLLSATACASLTLAQSAAAARGPRAFLVAPLTSVRPSSPSIFTVEPSASAKIENTERPSILGTPTVGETLKCFEGKWTAPLYAPAFSFKWLREGNVVGSGTTYLITATDEGHSLVCVVTAHSGEEEVSAGSKSVFVAQPPLYTSSGPPKETPEEEARARRIGEEASAERAAELRAIQREIEQANREIEEVNRKSEESTKKAEDARLLRGLQEAIFPMGKSAKLRTLLGDGGASFLFDSPDAGTLAVAWYEVPKGARLATKPEPIMVARGSASFQTPGVRRVVVKLTRTGKRFLRRAHAGKLTGKGVFTPTSGAPITALSTLALHR